MQPILPVQEHFRWGFAIYSSLGSLDLDCKEPLKFGIIKDMMKTPVYLASRSEFTSIVDNAWTELTLNDIAAAQAASKSKNQDNILVSFTLFQKMLNETHTMAPLMAPHKLYGWRDPRPWTFVIEETFFNAIYVDLMRKLRWESRCEEVCLNYLAEKDKRRKELVLVFWKQLLVRRCMVRKMIIVVSNRWKNDRTNLVFVKWRESILAQAAVILIQKWIRGFCARRRGKFIKRMHPRVIRIQALYRSHKEKQKVQQKIIGRRWAATHLQRIVRGFLARKKARSQLLAYVEVQRRLIVKKRKQWETARILKATIFIQMLIKRFIIKCRISKRVDLTRRVELANKEQHLVLEQARIQRDVFKLKLQEWYAEKKRLYDLVTIQEHTTAAEKKNILSYRRKQAEEVAKLKAKQREERLQKLEELKIEAWIAKWDNEVEARQKARRKYCQFALFNPETVEQQDLKKELLARIKKHILVVLKRADKQNIPMEIPEATDIATEEIIELEVEVEKKNVLQDRFEEATRIQKEEEEKKNLLETQEKEYKFRKREYSAELLQGYYRIYQARKIKTALAQKRFVKYFDVPSLTYYYKDKRSGKTQWEKPYALGDHDCDAVDGWIMISDKEGIDESYYYCPQTWQMQWSQPIGTILCEFCGREFGCVQMFKRNYGPDCLYSKAQELLEENDDPTHIVFKEFQGHTKNGANTRFSFVKETNWYAYCVKNDPVLKAMLEQAQRDEEERKRLAPTMCCRCSAIEAEVTCQMCTSPFCIPCYDSKHNVKPWTNHTFVPIVKAIPRSKEEKSEKDDKKKKKKKKKGDKGGIGDKDGEGESNNKGGKKSKDKDREDKGKKKKGGKDDVSVGSKSSKNSKGSKSSKGSKNSKDSKNSKSSKGSQGKKKKEGMKKEEGKKMVEGSSKEGGGKAPKKKKPSMAPVVEESSVTGTPAIAASDV
jgi:hypothetical protein